MKEINWAFDRNGSEYPVNDLDMILRVCIRTLMITNIEMLRCFMGVNPIFSGDGLPSYGWGDDDAECEIDRRRPPELGQLYSDWPEWAEYRVEVDEYYGFDQEFTYYDKATFEGYVKQALQAYSLAYPDSQTQIQKLIEDLNL
jgi:hypothetical protein